MSESRQNRSYLEIAAQQKDYLIVALVDKEKGEIILNAFERNSIGEVRTAKTNTLRLKGLNEAELKIEELAELTARNLKSATGNLKQCYDAPKITIEAVTVGLTEAEKIKFNEALKDQMAIKISSLQAQTDAVIALANDSGTKEPKNKSKADEVAAERRAAEPLSEQLNILPAKHLAATPKIDRDYALDSLKTGLHK